MTEGTPGWFNSAVHHEFVRSHSGITLTPLRPLHAEHLFPYIDSELWAGMAVGLPGSVPDLAELFTRRLEDAGTYAFAVVDDATRAVIGTSSLYDYNPEQRRVELGGTFYGRPFWGGVTNPAAKLMLLELAFTELGVCRVALRCDSRNTRSAAAIERLGATREGVLRGYRLAPDGTRVDTACFSILDNEWPAVREGLRRRLAAHDVVPLTAA